MAVICPSGVCSAYGIRHTVYDSGGTWHMVIDRTNFLRLKLHLNRNIGNHDDW